LANVQQEIIPGLFLSSRFGASNKDQLSKNSITHILVVGALISPAYPNQTWIYKHLDGILDNSNVNIRQHFKESFTFIEAALNSGGKVLVHCAAGRSRSASIVVGYIMHKRKISFSEAF